MRRVRDAGIGLKRALVRSAEAAGGSIEIVEDDFTAWGSATFSGGQHLVKIAGVRSDALDRWLEGLGACELAVPGQLVASMAVIATHRRGVRTDAHIQAMTVADAR